MFQHTIRVEWAANPLDLFSYPAVGGDDNIGVFAFPARRSPKLAARALKNKPSGGNIPQVDLRLDVTVKAAASHVRQRQRRRTHHSRLANFQRQLVEVRDHVIHRFFVLGKADRQHGFFQRPVVYLYSFAVELGRLTPDRRPKFFHKRIVHRTDDRFVILPIFVLLGQALLQRDRHAGVRNAVSEIHRAVDRVDHPAQLALDVAGILLLAKDGNLRMRLGQHRLDLALAAHVQFQLDVALGGFVDFLRGQAVTPHDVSSGMRRLHGNCKQVFLF